MKLSLSLSKLAKNKDVNVIVEFARFWLAGPGISDLLFLGLDLVT